MKRFVVLAIFLPLLLAQEDRPGVRTVTAVRHWVLGDVTRVAVEVSSDFKYNTERLHNPDRVYYDIIDARPRIGQHVVYSQPLDDQRVKRLRVAETVPGVTRVVLDLAGSVDVTATKLTNPDRLMIEVRAGVGCSGGGCSGGQRRSGCAACGAGSASIRTGKVRCRDSHRAGEGDCGAASGSGYSGDGGG